ncbi:hypothetical protein DRW07_05995 [Alteromonas sediminis]|uniref:SGNH hydrolase-type esterase domain-containing protein n=1 Tax=Alteromonas sediminis TaxID=2259342 RepID=A0A3N5YND8_9ALTE|nr:tetratricopeptide repeat protein [Alteromonas sediminis]RPJ67091.1 hypothetical protein DRW07_05995 [Alteromonas sediminis]
MSPAKKLLFSFIALVVIPAFCLLALEGGLRLAGVGTHYTYFNEIDIDGEKYLQDNKSFANQFYPSSLGVAPLNNTLSVNQDQDLVRVFVLGGSAAQGFPHVNHGMDRHLSAHLKTALPNKNIEIINTAMTSVNSHVVYEVARTLPANSADYAVILMGNNEVVGPYGPSTFSQNFLSSLTLIRTLQALKRTRIWQVIAMFVEQAQVSSGEGDLEWQGMQMFSGFSVPHDDPRLTQVYSHYESNLKDIITLLQQKGMHVILSSVPVNTRHSAPFGSRHKSTLTESELTQWHAMNSKAEEAFINENWQAAVTAYAAMLEIDDEYADSHFRLATALENLNKFEAAKQHFELALHYDTKRFRTNHVINNIIQRVAIEKAGEQLTYVDNVDVFNAASAPYAPGLDLLHEHVHFDFAGNYYLAREFTQAIMSDIAPSEQYKRLAKHQTAALIGFPNHETNQVMERMLNMIQKAPFTEQSNHIELKAHTEARKETLEKQVGRPAEVVERRQSIVDKGLADWKIHYELAELHRFLRNKEQHYFHLSEVIRLYPHNHESYIKMAEYLSAEGKFSQANAHLQRSLHYTRNSVEKEVQALGWLGLNYMKLNDYFKGKSYLQDVVRQYPEQIGANIRAYGLLVKYARDNNQNDDLRQTVDAVKDYASALIEAGRDKEFPLLYRRMAQIMTLAGESEEAKHWQALQTS